MAFSGAKTRDCKSILRTREPPLLCSTSRRVSLTSALASALELELPPTAFCVRLCASRIISTIAGKEELKPSCVKRVSALCAVAFGEERSDRMKFRRFCMLTDFPVRCSIKFTTLKQEIIVCLKIYSLRASKRRDVRTRVYILVLVCVLRSRSRSLSLSQIRIQIPSQALMKFICKQQMQYRTGNQISSRYSACMRVRTVTCTCQQRSGKFAATDCTTTRKLLKQVSNSNASVTLLYASAKVRLQQLRPNQPTNERTNEVGDAPRVRQFASPRIAKQFLGTNPVRCTSEILRNIKQEYSTIFPIPVLLCYILRVGNTLCLTKYFCASIHECICLSTQQF